MLDIFNDAAFSTTSLTDAINDLKFKPGRISAMGLFEEVSVDTTSIAIEKKGDILIIVPPTPRGSPGVTLEKEKRDLRSLIVPHFEINDAIMAEEVQNIRQFGKVQALETVMAKVAQRQVTHVTSHTVTEEVARLGAVQGIITYSDGSSLNLFNEFGVTQAPEINFDLGGAVDGAFREACTKVTRKVEDILDGVPFDGIHAFCGDDFFDAVLKNAEVRETYKGWDEAKILREAYVGPRAKNSRIFEFGGIIWENYRGAKNSPTAINKDKSSLFPVGVPGLFKTARAPADYVDTVNTMGERLYMQQYLMQNKKGVHLDSQMNALQYCTRPASLLKARRA